MKSQLLAIIILMFSLNISAQNLLGFEAEKIEDYIANNHRELVKDDNKNEHYKYLKYTDGLSGTTTVYFFLSEDNKCTRVKRIHVHSLKDEVLEELDNDFEKVDENTWTDKGSGQNAVIKLVNEEWFFTVIIEPESKK